MPNGLAHTMPARFPDPRYLAAWTHMILSSHPVVYFADKPDSLRHAPGLIPVLRLNTLLNEASDW